MTQTITYTGASGQTYVFSIYDVNVTWNPVPAIYAMIDRQWTPKYIGQTDNLTNRRPGLGHDKWPLAASHGAFAVAVHVVQGGEAIRKAEEADLIRAYNPPANIQHRTGVGLLGRPSTGFGLGAQVGRKTILGGSL